MFGLLCLCPKTPFNVGGSLTNVAAYSDDFVPTEPHCVAHNNIFDMISVTLELYVQHREVVGHFHHEDYQQQHVSSHSSR